MDSIICEDNFQYNKIYFDKFQKLKPGSSPDKLQKNAYLKLINPPHKTPLNNTCIQNEFKQFEFLYVYSLPCSSNEKFLLQDLLKIGKVISYFFIYYLLLENCCI